MVFSGGDLVGFGIIYALFRHFPIVFFIDASGSGFRGSDLTLACVLFECRFKEPVELGAVLVIEYNFLRIGFIDAEEVSY